MPSSLHYRFFNSNQIKRLSNRLVQRTTKQLRTDRNDAILNNIELEFSEEIESLFDHLDQQLEGQVKQIFDQSLERLFPDLDSQLRKYITTFIEDNIDVLAIAEQFFPEISTSGLNGDSIGKPLFFLR